MKTLSLVVPISAHGSVVAVFVALLATGGTFEAAPNEQRHIRAALTNEEVALQDYDIREVKFEGQAYIARRDTVAFSALGDFFAQHFQAIYGRLAQMGAELAGPPTGIYWSWDEEKGQTYMAAAVPVANANVTVAGYEPLSVPAGRAVVTDHFGAYEATAGAHEAIDAYLKEHGIGQPDAVLEEYITDPTLEPDSSKWHTRILYVYEE